MNLTRIRADAAILKVTASVPTTLLTGEASGFWKEQWKVDRVVHRPVAKPVILAAGRSLPGDSAGRGQRALVMNNPETPAQEFTEKPVYCRHSPSERTMLGVDRQHGSEICLGCRLPYLPGSPNSRLRRGAQLGTVPPPEVGTVRTAAGGDGGRPVYRNGTGTGGGRRTPNNQIATKGFFASLFDFGFTSFITLKFLSFIYSFVVVLILLTSVVLFIAGLSQGGIYAGLAIVVIPIVTLLYLVVTRVSLEIVALFFRIGENTSLMAAAANRPGPTSKGGTSEG